MSLNMSPHRVTILVSDPARRAAGSVKRASVCRDARDPLHNGIPGDVWSGGDDRRIGGVHHYKVTTVGLTCKAGGTKSTEHILRSCHMPPTFRRIPVIETSMSGLNAWRCGVTHNPRDILLEL